MSLHNYKYVHIHVCCMLINKICFQAAYCTNLLNLLQIVFFHYTDTKYRQRERHRDRQRDRHTERYISMQTQIHTIIPRNIIESNAPACEEVGLRADDEFCKTGITNDTAVTSTESDDNPQPHTIINTHLHDNLSTYILYITCFHDYNYEYHFSQNYNIQ